LLALNKKFKKGIPLPLGADLNLEPIPIKVTIYKDYLLAETHPNEQRPPSSHMHSWSHYSTYDPQKESQRLRNYPVTWTIDQSHQVTKVNANNTEDRDRDRRDDTNEECEGNNCQE